jgi:hypothetical protein
LEGAGDSPASHRVIVHDKDLNGRIGEVRIGSGAAEVQEQLERHGGGLDRAGGPGIRVLEQFLEHVFQRGTQPERRAQFSALSLGASRVDLHIELAQEFLMVGWRRVLLGHLQPHLKLLDRRQRVGGEHPMTF